mmetsp:Transcript_3138/g.7153  ORF Transcript_3138/g.7153 Transcript_3138/m.7153 type:complete len:110 (-) Transcript_3138:2397-2726(-)
MRTYDLFDLLQQQKKSPEERMSVEAVKEPENKPAYGRWLHAFPTVDFSLISTVPTSKVSLTKKTLKFQISRTLATTNNTINNTPDCIKKHVADCSRQPPLHCSRPPPLH